MCIFQWGNKVKLLWMKTDFIPAAQRRQLAFEKHKKPIKLDSVNCKLLNQTNLRWVNIILTTNSEVSVFDVTFGILQHKMKTISGSSGRSLLLLITNILLMALGAITVASGSMAIGIFLLHLFTFASQLFLVVPVLLIMSGTLTIIVAIFGLSLFKRKNEKRWDKQKLRK